MQSTIPRFPESSVTSRHAAAAKAPEPALCCPVEYNRDLLKIIPQEVIEKDSGCGDPSRYVKPGETVLKRDAQPWQTVAGIEFRSVTVEASKGMAYNATTEPAQFRDGGACC